MKHQESGIQISLELGLRSRGMLVNWVREYKENGYNVVTRKKGRPSAHDKEQKEVAQRTGSRGQAAEAGKLRAAYQKLLYKKTKRPGLLAALITTLCPRKQLSANVLHCWQRLIIFSNTINGAMATAELHCKYGARAQK